jgi:hypothetical protein
MGYYSVNLLLTWRIPVARTIKNPTLLKLIGNNKWRVTYEESWYVEDKVYREANKIDYEQIKIRGGGHLMLKDLKSKTFVLWTQRYKVAHEVIAKYPEIVMDKMDKECDLIIPVHLVDAVLEIFHGARKKTMSAEWRAKSANRMRDYQARKRAEKS